MALQLFEALADLVLPAATADLTGQRMAPAENFHVREDVDLASRIVASRDWPSDADLFQSDCGNLREQRVERRHGAVAGLIGRV